mmetsp:Transcript_3112/g.3503  ORF Transcript_3112/g.3503 Transcript_3112/m.3503 type:complete len:326 (+) Transcript_3112:99-1076(+)
MRSSSRLACVLSNKSLYTRILHSKSCTSRRLSTSTYYDSQSGLTLPVHDEKCIRLFLDISKNNDNDELSTTSTPFVPHQLNKHRDEADEMLDKLKRLVAMGIGGGIILPPLKFSRDLRNLKVLTAIAPSNFFLLCSRGQTTSSNGNNDDVMLNDKGFSASSINLSKIFQYDNNNGDEEMFHNAFQNSIRKDLHTTLSITQDIYVSENSRDLEPIKLANNIASTIDAKGGCDFIWISSKRKAGDDTPSGNPPDLVADSMVQVCEELIYLDVAGATIKSRLLVDSLNEDTVQDTMFAGVNKFVIDNEDQVEMVETVAKEQGKILLCS